MESLRVLLVDDDEDFIDVLAERLAMRGARVETANRGDQAIERARERSFDVIVLDLAMPGMDGLATLEALRERDADAQVVLLTGQATVRTGVDAMKLGAFDLLEKPTPMAHLEGKIRQAAARRARRTAARVQQTIDGILRSRAW